MTSETYTCIVCDESETDQRLLEYCGGCSDLFHLNPYNRPGKDCGEAWLEDEDSGMQFSCNDCMDEAKAEEARIHRMAEAAGADPSVLAEFMRGMAAQQSAGSLVGQLPGGNAFGMPQMPGMQVPGIGMPGVSLPSLGDSPTIMTGAEVQAQIAKLQAQLAAQEAADAQPSPRTSEAPRVSSGDAPPKRQASAPRTRRFRRID